jgi:hypothetical protein
MATSTGMTTTSTTGVSVIVNSQVLHPFKGWGIYPAPYDRVLPTFSTGSDTKDASWLDRSSKLYDAVAGLNFNIARLDISSTLGKPDNTLDNNRLQDLRDYLKILKDRGITDYIISNWSPPAYMKAPQQVRWGQTPSGQSTYLDPKYVNSGSYGYADYIVAVLTSLRTSGFKPPLAISPQNEPDYSPIWDGANYTLTNDTKQTYRNLVKELRVKLDAAGFGTVQILAPETQSLDSIKTLLGTPSSTGFSELTNDPILSSSIGGFAFHSYATSGSILDYRQAFNAYPNKDIWMTEYALDSGIRGELQAASPSSQLNWALNYARRMAGDLVDLGADYWFFWRGWSVADAANPEDLLYGDGINTIATTKSYTFFQKLWSLVKPGWTVQRVTDTDTGPGSLRSDNNDLIQSHSSDEWSAPVDLLAFESPDQNKSTVMLVNSSSSTKTIRDLRRNKLPVILEDRKCGTARSCSQSLELEALG